MLSSSFITSAIVAAAAFASTTTTTTSFALSNSVPISTYDVTWLSPTPFDGKMYTDGMPAGNGRVVVLAWANTTNGGMGFYVRSPLALHTDSQLFTLAEIQISLSPNPFNQSQGTYFNQSQHLTDGSITVLAGGTSYDDYVAIVNLYVDANSDAVIVTAGARETTQAAFTLTVEMSSVRPAEFFTYTSDFQCNSSASHPDIIVSGALPLPAPSNSLAIYHVNNVASGDTDFFGYVLKNQGLESLLTQFNDTLDGRIFGLGITGGSGDDGAGTPLVRTSATTLVSATPASSFAVLVAVHIDVNANTNEEAWLEGLAQELQGIPNPASRVAASQAWFANFWARSYISLADSPPPPPHIGVFSCGGASTAYQNMSLDPNTNLITLPGNQCFAPSADGTSVSAGPCTGPGTQQWKVTPCAASNCNAGEMWVQSTSQNLVLGLPGATCPFLDVWTPDNPTGDLKNELFYFNSTDNTLRAFCTNCPNQCVTLATPPSAAEETATSTLPSILASQYARFRFMEMTQARGHNSPIKFNGMLYLNSVFQGGPLDVDYRQWGSDNWWQNTRLPYGNALSSGDVELLRNVLDWLSGFVPLLQARTALLLPGESGIFSTETVNAYGLYQGGEYGCDHATNRPEGYPVWLEGPGSEGGWVRYDFGGNAFGPEAGQMAIDYYWYTLDEETAAKYIPIATNTLDFYRTHYQNRSADGKFLLWPTQVLETYWCEWPGWTNCVENDMPQVAAVHALTERLLQLPEATGFLTPQQRADYQAFQAILPSLPLQSDSASYAPAQVLSSGTHNAEVPELFAVHPFRLITVGRSLANNIQVPNGNLTTAQTTWDVTPLAQQNTGWYYGGIDAALLGLANQSYAMLQDRASVSPATGYRYPTFAQHYQDSPPSADHFANMMTALQWSLIQSGEDANTAATIVLLPSWPCEIDVSFKLWTYLNTSVEVVYANQTLVSLDVQPASRASAVKWANCVPN